MKETRAEHLAVDKLRPFDEHPFKVVDNEEMDQLVWSILTQGLLTPLVVRPLDNGEYEVISGHRRLYACKKAGIETVPALIYAIDRDAAAIALVDSNLQREHILPSEKAYAYKLKLEAMNHQGRTSGQVGQKWSRDEIAEGESGRQVQRYIRLTNLIPRHFAKGGRRKNRPYPGGGVVLPHRMGTAGSAGNHGERGLHSVPFPGDSDEGAESIRSAGYGHDLPHHDPAEGQPAGEDQLQGIRAA